MSTGLAVALGLVFAPAVAMPLAQTFAALGPDAVFGPGCSNGSTTLALQAPARWRTAPPRFIARLGSGPITVIAEFGGGRVRSVHLSREPARHMTEQSCRATLASLPGQAIAGRSVDADHVFERILAPIAGNPARYRAVFRPLRGACRTMLTIGA